jgi:hypothetical protein
VNAGIDILIQWVQRPAGYGEEQGFITLDADAVHFLANIDFKNCMQFVTDARALVRAANGNLEPVHAFKGNTRDRGCQGHVVKTLFGFIPYCAQLSQAAGFHGGSVRNYAGWYCHLL